MQIIQRGFLRLMGVAPITVWEETDSGQQIWEDRSNFIPDPFSKPAEIHVQKHGDKKEGRDQAVTRTPSPWVLRAREARPQLEGIRYGHHVGLKGDSRSSL